MNKKQDEREWCLHPRSSIINLSLVRISWILFDYVMRFIYHPRRDRHKFIHVARAGVPLTGCLYKIPPNEEGHHDAIPQDRIHGNAPA